MTAEREADMSDDDDPYLHYDEEGGCANCGDEGFVYGCAWDWQCDTYDAGEGTCLCTRPCEWCHPVKPDPVLQEVLRSALAKESTHE